MRSTPLKHAIHFSLIASSLLAAAVSSERAAYALQGGEDPALLPVLVDKRFGGSGRHQLSLNFSTSMVPKFEQSTGAFATYQYNFSDLFGLELHGGFFVGSETDMIAQVRAKVADPQLTDLFQTEWVGGADLMLVPVYGKMSFASEFDPSFDLFLIAGGGGAGVRNLQMDGSYVRKVVPAFNFGLGFRFYFSRLVALRLEFRDFLFPDPGQRETSPGGPKEDVGGITFDLHFQGGLQFSFGGDE